MGVVSKIFLPISSQIDMGEQLDESRVAILSEAIAKSGEGLLSPTLFDSANPIPSKCEKTNSRFVTVTSVVSANANRVVP